jgi:hyperosmotically inducible periplasmic protein
MMKKTFAYLTITAALAIAPLTFTGCSIMQGRESAGAYTHDKEIAAKIKTQMYKDPIVKGTQVDVNVFNGVAQLSGFVDSQQAKDRAGEIAQNTKGVTQVYNNLILPTGRTNEPIK